MKARVVAVLLVVEALVLVVTTTIDSPSQTMLVAGLVAILATSFATLGAVVVRAFAARTGATIASAACWAVWWIMDALVLIWALRMTLGSAVDQPPSFSIVPLIFGAAAALLAAIAALSVGRQRGGPALVALLVGCLLVWCFGEMWLMNISVSEDADRIHALRTFGEVGFVGWHLVLAVLLWRAGQVTSRTASP